MTNGNFAKSHVIQAWNTVATLRSWLL